MTTETKHTPTPWRLDLDAVCDADGNDMAFAIGTDGDDYKTHLANAAHIVRCVNSHDELLAALQTLLESVEGKKVTFGDCNQARAAIERATKG